MKKIVLMLMAMVVFGNVLGAPSNSVMLPSMDWSGGSWTDDGHQIERIHFSDDGSSGYMIWVKTKDGYTFTNKGLVVDDKVKMLYSSLLAAKSNGSYVNFRYGYDGTYFIFNAIITSN